MPWRTDGMGWKGSCGVQPPPTHTRTVACQASTELHGTQSAFMSCIELFVFGLLVMLFQTV